MSYEALIESVASGECAAGEPTDEPVDRDKDFIPQPRKKKESTRRGEGPELLLKFRSAINWQNRPRCGSELSSKTREGAESHCTLGQSTQSEMNNATKLSSNTNANKIQRPPSTGRPF